jgi:hypothetical protein
MKAKSVRFPQAGQIRRMLGLNPGKLPANLTVQTWKLGGLNFRLNPAKTVPVFRSRPHRLEVECPVCSKWMSVGRFNQHQGIHPRETRSELTNLYIQYGGYVDEHHIPEFLFELNIRVNAAKGE